MEKDKVRLETTEQIIFVNRVRAFHPQIMLIAIPNGGKRDIRTAKRLKDEGVLAGVPDMFFPHAADGWHGLFIEMKRVKGGVISPQQKAIAKLLKSNGYKVEFAYGADDAYSKFKFYFNIN